MTRLITKKAISVAVIFAVMLAAVFMTTGFANAATTYTYEGYTFETVEHEQDGGGYYYTAKITSIDTSVIKGDVTIPQKLQYEENGETKELDVEIIGNKAFRKCTEITSVTIPDTVTEIGSSAFDSCSNLESVSFSKGLKTIGGSAFMLCGSLKEVSLPESLEYIGTFAFHQCDSLKTVDIPSGKIDANAFLQDIILENVTFGDKVTSIGALAFANDTKIKFISIPDSVTNLGNGAFSNCSGLEKVVIGTGLSTIDGSAFAGCTNLADVYYTGTETEWNNIAIDTTSSSDNYFTNVTKHYDYVDSIAEVIFDAESYAYTGGFITPEITVKNAAGIVLSDGVDYTVAFENNFDVGTATAVVAGMGKYEGDDNVIRVDFEIVPCPISKVTVKSASYTYTGKAITPEVAVTAKKERTLVEGRDFTVSYKNNKNVGTATVTVEGIGSYTGTVTKTFAINPVSTSITKLKKAKKAFTVKWAKKTTQVTGYQIRYATNSKFTGAKTVKVASTKTVSKKIKKLKAKKNYYVQVRTYKTVSGKNYYSAWSKAKRVKTK